MILHNNKKTKKRCNLSPEGTDSCARYKHSTVHLTAQSLTSSTQRKKKTHLRRRLGAMQLTDVVHPLLNLVRVFVCVLDGPHRHIPILQFLAFGAQLQFQHRGVGLVGGGLVQKVQSQSVVLAIWPGHLRTMQIQAYAKERCEKKCMKDTSQMAL